MKRVPVPVIDNATLRSVLSEMQLLEQFEAGKAHCFICNRTMTWDNTYGVFLDGSELRFVCDDYRCFDRLREQRPEKIAV